MRCPNCGKKPMPFTRFMTKLNPFRITCVHCATELRAGQTGYWWTLFHAPLMIGIAELGHWLSRTGRIATPMHLLLFVVAAIGLVFFTSFVIPWYGFNGMYRVASPSTKEARS